MYHLTEDLWGELKAYAKDYAVSDRPLPPDDECEAWLRDRLRQRGATLPKDAFDFYAGELCKLITDYRSDKEQTAG